MPQSDPELTELPSLTLGDDEIQNHQTSLQRQQPDESAPSLEAPLNRPLWLLLILLLCAMGAGGYLASQQQTQLQLALEQSQHQILQLKDQLNRNTARAQSREAAAQQQLDKQRTQIDQLLALAGTHNRPIIEQLEKDLSAHTTQLSKIDLALSQSGKNLDRISKIGHNQQALEELGQLQQKKIAQLQSANGVTFALLQEQLQKLERQQKTLIKQQKEQSQRSQTLASKSEAFDDAVRSLDTYRQQINRQLLNLQQQLQTQ